ncbi:MAG: Na/Pi cotransporter family protein [Ruminococcus sp.]|nr:Na/Pi cotransporter family protein [Ruminococcus sp.]
MDIFSVFSLLGGLAFFLYGMNVMSTGLEKLAGGKLEVVLKKITSNKFKSLLLGMGITIAIQSSSAMTVMLVGLVNSGIMQLEQTVGILMGSNVGTTLTSWLLSLTGVDSDNIFVNLLKPESLSPIIALVGIMFIMIPKSSKKKDIGRICIGFAVLMTGMTFMSDAVSPLAESPEFQNILTAFRNPILGVLVGAVFTGVIQSSAASVGILQAFSLTGGLTYGMALPIIMGQNIGTCVTALISSIGVNKNAKRVAVVHILFNCIGTLVFLPIVLILQYAVKLPLFEEAVSPVGIAVMHTIFNVLTTGLLLPFSKYIVKAAYFIIKDSDAEREEAAKKNVMLDERLLKTPAVAVEACRSATVDMAQLTRTTILDALGLLKKYDSKIADRVIEGESTIDNFEDKLNSYLVKISKSSITSSDGRTVSKMMHIIGNLERISDHAVNLVESAREMHDKQYTFSDECKKEIEIISEAITENINKAFDAYINDDLDMAHTIEPLEEVVDILSSELKSRHVERLQSGECTIELGYIYQDILTNLERISDHCSNIAGFIIGIDEKTNIHAYLHDVKENDELFRKEYRSYSSKYFLKLGICDSNLDKRRLNPEE